MRSLVVGYGSIGVRHSRLLNELGCSTAVVSRRQIDFQPVYSNLTSAIEAHHPDYIVLANPTSEHYRVLAELAAIGFAGRVLVEKPLFERMQPLPQYAFESFAVAYNLRFHPVIQRLRDLTAGEMVLSVQAYVGQYLPDWRPGTDYRQSYSASTLRGGGVLRDLSHELDYLCWMFGEWISVTALGGHVSTLEINSDDLFVLLMQTKFCPAVSVQMSYLDRVARRRITVNTANHTIEADLVAGSIRFDSELEVITVDRDHTYREMHHAMLAGDVSQLCSVTEGLNTMRLIEAVERANRQMKWIKR